MRETPEEWRILATLLCFGTTWGCDEWHDIGLHTSQVSDLEVFIQINQDSIAPSPSESHHLELLQCHASPDSSTCHSSRDFEGNVLHYQFPIGVWDLLVYNNDVWFLHFDNGICRTEEKLEAVLPTIDSLQLLEPILNEPDDFWRGIIHDYVSTRDPSSYVWDPARKLSVQKDTIVLDKLSCDYSITAWLVHNNGRVVDSGALTLSGLADGCSIYQAKTTDTPAAFQSYTTFSPEKTNAKGKETEYANAQGSIRCWGLPSVSNVRNVCYLTLTYANGKSRCIGIDVSTVMTKMPHGGELTIFIDINNYDTPTTNEGMAFDVVVHDWDEQWHHWIVGRQ